MFRLRPDRLRPDVDAEREAEQTTIRREHALAGNPYLVLGRRPYRLARVRSYIIAQHRSGRSLAEIMNDPYIRRCGNEGFCWRALLDPRTIDALQRDVREAIERSSPYGPAQLPAADATSRG